MFNFLSGQSFSSKFNFSYSSLQDLLLGVLKGSVLLPLLFKVYICDLYFFFKDYNLANYTGNTTSDIMNDIFGQINISER